MLVREAFIKKSAVRSPILNWVRVLIDMFSPSTLSGEKSRRFFWNMRRSLWRKGSNWGQTVKTCRGFSISLQPCWQLGSTSGSILCFKEFRKWCSDRSLWRHTEIFRSVCWCHRIGLRDGFIVRQFLLQFFKDRRNLAAQCFLYKAIFSSGERLLFMWGSMLLVHWMPVSWSARHSPLYRVGSVSRLALSCQVAPGFLELLDDWLLAMMALMTGLE